jgi:gliding motility-associated-like protein
MQQYSRIQRGIKICQFFVILMITVFAIPQKSYATHLFGGELFYTHISGMQYRVTMVLYGDCSGSPAAFSGLNTATPEVYILNGTSLFQTVYLTIQPGSGTNVSPVCPDEINNTTCNNGNLPGVKKFTYAANVTLNTNSANWKFKFSGEFANGTSSGRSSTITNTMNAGSGLMVLEATLNNTTVQNSSPSYTTIPTPFFCINKPQEYNQGAIDPNGDSLLFEMVPGLIPTTSLAISNTVTYVAGFNAVNPLLSAAGTYNFSSSTGQISFVPNAVQRALVVNRVTEYRNGIAVGTSMREMTFIVLNNCNNNPSNDVITSPVNVTVNNNIIKACKIAGNISFSITLADPDGDNVTVTTAGIPTGAVSTVTSNTTPNPIFNFSWNITNVPIGNYTFFITVTDDGCPLVSKQTYAYTIQVLPKPQMTYQLVEQPNCNKKGIFNVTPIGTDAPYNLTVTQSNSTVLTRNNIATLITDSLSAGTYNFRITGANGCFKDTVITLTQVVNVVPHLTWTSPLCVGGSTGTVQASATGNQPPFQFAINSSAYNNTGVFTDLPAGAHVLHVKDAEGCIKDTVFTIAPPPAIGLVLSITKPVCQPISNGSVSITVSNGTAPYQYAINATPFGANNMITGLGAGTHVVHVKDANNCTKDTSIILVDSMIMQLQATLTTPVSCFGDANAVITLTGSGATAPYTYALGNGTYGVSNIFNNLGVGTYTFKAKDNNQCEKSTNITITQPAVLAITTVGLTHINCHGLSTGAITVNAQGGTAPYQYAVNNMAYQNNNTISGLAAGTYTFHVKDAHNCIKDTIVTLMQPSSAVAFGQFVIIDATCEGFADGAVQVLGAGGTPPYQYAVDGVGLSSNGNLIGLREGTYIIRVQDSKGCFKDTTINVGGYPHINIDQITFTQPSCYDLSDGAINVSISGGNPPLTLRLGTSTNFGSATTFNNIKGGAYLLSVRDARGCIKDSNIVLLQPDPIHIDTSLVGNDCNGFDDGGVIDLTITGGTEPYHYQWQHDANLDTPYVRGLQNGRYSVEVTDAKGCTADATVDIRYNNCCSPFIPNAFTPNGDGLNDEFMILYKGDMVLKELSIYNRYGQRMFNGASQLKGWDGTLNGNLCDAGVYFYYIKILCGNVSQKEVVFKGDFTLMR